MCSFWLALPLSKQSLLESVRPVPRLIRFSASKNAKGLPVRISISDHLLFPRKESVSLKKVPSLTAVKHASSKFCYTFYHTIATL